MCSVSSCAANTSVGIQCLQNCSSRTPVQRGEQASPAWWGSTSAADKQRLEASVRHGAIRLGLYTADDRTPSQLAADMDDNLFANILNNPHHRVLHKFLPDNTDDSLPSSVNASATLEGTRKEPGSSCKE